MALNLDAYINKFLVLAYPIAKDCTCRIERETMKALRQTREKKMRVQLKDIPYNDQIDVVKKMIEKEQNERRNINENHGSTKSLTT